MKEFKDLVAAFALMCAGLIGPFLVVGAIANMIVTEYRHALENLGCALVAFLIYHALGGKWNNGKR